MAFSEFNCIILKILYFQKGFIIDFVQVKISFRGECTPMRHLPENFKDQQFSAAGYFRKGC